RQDVDVVVSVHFQVAELQQVVGCNGRKGVHVSAERVSLQRPATGCQGAGDAAELVLLLEVGNLARQARLRKLQDLNELREFRESAQHPGAVYNEFADCVHHSVKPLK